MNTYIVFLRGINVGGHKKFPKAEQLAMLANLSYENSKVYLHTGNWTFISKESKEVVEKNISEAIKKTYNWEVPIIVKTVSEIVEVLSLCPFPSEEKEKSYFTLLHSPPEEEFVEVASAISYPNEKFKLTATCVYFYSSHGYGNAKLSNNWFEKKLGVSATTRNYNTMVKICTLARV